MDVSKNEVSVAAIIVLGAMETVALATGTDGALFLPVAAMVSGLAGYKIGEKKGCEKDAEKVQV